MPTREEMRSLTQEIISSYEARAAGITSLREEVNTQRQAAQAQLQELHGDHQAMARRQRAELAKGCAELTKGERRRKSEVNAWINEAAQAHQAMAQKQRAELAKGHADLIQEVNAWINEVVKGHQAMAQKQRADLTKGRADLIQADTQRKSESNAWMNEIAAAHAGARDEWQQMTATMQAKRAIPLADTVPCAEVSEVTPRNRRAPRAGLRASGKSSQRRHDD